MPPPTDLTLERYDAGQYERKCYRVLVAGWLGWKGRNRIARRFEALLR